MARTPAEELMKREARVSFGRVPHSLFGEELEEAMWQLDGDQFLLRGEGQHYFHYRKGEGVTVERGSDADLSEESLWLNGSVYAAIASLNGLLPLHASAVACGRKVFAFTGPAGAGKSTLIAALGNRGLAMFCDDTLVLDLTDPKQITCLPGHKRLKLTPESIELTGTTREERVSCSLDKFYARPPSGEVGAVLPLARLIFLEDGSEPQIIPISGGERFVRMRDDHYTAHLFAAARNFDRAGQFAHVSRVARQIEMARFVRPRDTTRFHDSVAIVADYVEASA
jgi:hypothetical protein